MYSPAAIAAVRGGQGAFDPGNLLNPGNLVDPDPVDADLRVAQAARSVRTKLALAYPHDGGDFGQAVHRCTGVGKCRADNTAAGGVMCPSYLATRDEKDSTRGRARVLQEMLDGDARAPGWRPEPCTTRSTCACPARAARRDCPTGVDMATYKAEVLHQTYRGGCARARTTRSAGCRAGRLAGWMPRLANLACRLAAGLAGSRCGWPAWTSGAVPAFARRPVPPHVRWRARRGNPANRSCSSPTASPTHFSPEVAEATVRVLRRRATPRITVRRRCAAA
jgi:Fe-S oxidoreductase